jgi:hypothetical protein
MSRELEDRLRRALRPVDPGEVFTRRVLSQLPHPHNSDATRRRWWIPAALAASLLLVAGGALQIHRRQQLAGLAARNQVLEALQVTSQKLDLASRLVNRPAATPGTPAGGPGA